MKKTINNLCRSILVLKQTWCKIEKGSPEVYCCEANSFDEFSQIYETLFKLMTFSYSQRKNKA